MTLSPYAGYGAGLPLSAQSAPNMSSIVQSLTQLTASLTQLVQSLSASLASSSVNQAYLGQSSLGGGASSSSPPFAPSSPSSYGGGAPTSGSGCGCGMPNCKMDAASGVANLDPSGSTSPASETPPIPDYSSVPSSSPSSSYTPPDASAPSLGSFDMPPLPDANTTAPPIPAPDAAAPAGPAPAGPASSKGQAVVDTAKGKLGVSYVYGASGPDHFDCSGLTQWAMKQNGIDIPRTAAEQQNGGTPVDKANLQPGDLVFFGSPAHHVGMYVGNGEYIHAPQTGDVVKISKLDDNKEFTNARRYT